MGKDVIPQRSSFAEQAEGQTADYHRAIPIDFSTGTRWFRGGHHAWPAAALPSAACAAASRAIGTRNGEQET